MKVLLINGSPHAKGCTYTALSEVAASLQKEGIETELMHIGSKPIRGCIACGHCKLTGKCVFDDVVNEAIQKFAQCDGLVIGSPIYYAAPAGEFVSFLDRMFYCCTFDMRMKVGAAVVSCRRGGASTAFDQLNKYFTIAGMPIASSHYWNRVRGNSPAEVRKDEEGLQTMRILGQNIAFLVKAVALAKETYGLPEREEHIATNFNGRAF